MTYQPRAELVPLGELGDIVSGSTPKTNVKEYWNGDIPWITPADLTDHQGVWFRGKLKRISKLGFEACSTRMLPRGSILFSSRAPIGHCAVAAYPVCTNQGFKSLIPNERLDSVYGYFALRAVTPSIVARGRGATFAEVSKEIMDSVRIPVRPLPEQKRIAAILEKADRLRRTRRYARQLSDTFLQSVFLEMFGDPVINERAWGVDTLRSQCDNITDGTHDTPDRVSSGVPFITSKNVRPYEVDLSELEFVTAETHREIIRRCNPRLGDVLYTNIGVNVGNAVANRLRFGFSVKNVALIQPNSTQLDSFYLESLLNNERFKQHILRISSVGGAQKFVALEILREIKVIIPPLALQQKFASIVRRFERLRAQQREAERQAEHLFQTLLYEAFSGQS